MSSEPYEGSDALTSFDTVIDIAIPKYEEGVARARSVTPSTMQSMAGVLIPQVFSLTFAVRALVRDGFLFSAHVLLRPLIERVCILMYLDRYPSEIEIWKRGWKHGEAPSLSRMFDKLKAPFPNLADVTGSQMTSDLNGLVHGKPEAAHWNLTGLGHSPGLIRDNPELCDIVCRQAAHYLAVTTLLIGRYFPDASPQRTDSP